LAENCEFFLPHSHLTPSLGVNPFEFLDDGRPAIPIVASTGLA